MPELRWRDGRRRTEPTKVRRVGVRTCMPPTALACDAEWVGDVHRRYEPPNDSAALPNDPAALPKGPDALTKDLAALPNHWGGQPEGRVAGLAAGARDADVGVGVRGGLLWVRPRQQRKRIVQDACRGKFAGWVNVTHRLPAVPKHHPNLQPPAPAAR